MNKITIALLLGSFGLAAQAADLTLTYTGKSGQSAYTNLTSRYVGGAMQYLDSQGKSYEAFCVEPTQSHAVAADGAVTYALGSFGGDQARLLQGLFSSSYAGLSTAYQRGAFQIAVWEVIGEASGTTLDLSAGAFQFLYLTRTSTAADNSAFAALASSYLTAAAAYAGPALYDIQRLSSGSFQDLVVATPVPEPSSYALLLGGLALVAFAKRRKA